MRASRSIPVLFLSIRRLAHARRHRRRDEHHEGVRHDGRSRPAVAHGSARRAHRRRRARTGAASRRCCASSRASRSRPPAASSASARPAYLPQEPERRAGETLLGFLARRTGVADAEARMDAGSDDYHDALERFLALGGADLEPRARKVCARLGIERPARRGGADALRRRGGTRVARGAAALARSTSSASTSRRTISTSTGSSGSSASCRAIAARSSSSRTTASSSTGPSRGSSRSTRRRAR